MSSSLAEDHAGWSQQGEIKTASDANDITAVWWQADWPTWITKTFMSC